MQWVDTPRGWIHSTREWQLVVGCPDCVNYEDLTDQIAGVLPGIQYLTRFNLEGKFSRTSAALAASAANFMARRVHGIVIDAQKDSIASPSGVVRLASIQRRPSFSVIALSWWFLDGPLLTALGREHLVDLLTRDLPEALPKRYGLYEPPQHRYALMGRDHFLAFLNDHLNDFIVWSAQWPVVRVHIGYPKRAGGGPSGFRANHFEIELDRDLLKQPGWDVGLLRFWEKASKLIQPFYGDARVLPGRIGTVATTLLTSSESESHPVRAWWWRGIPKTLGCAVVLGEVYQGLWPQFMTAANLKHGLAFVSSQDWLSGETVTSQTGQVPENIASRPFLWPDGHPTAGAPLSTPDSYPEQWPFEDPFGG